MNSEEIKINITNKKLLHFIRKNPECLSAFVKYNRKSKSKNGGDYVDLVKKSVDDVFSITGGGQGEKRKRNDSEQKSNTKSVNKSALDSILNGNCIKGVKPCTNENTPEPKRLRKNLTAIDFFILFCNKIHTSYKQDENFNKIINFKKKH